MESKKAQKIIDKILSDLNHAGIIINTLIDDLKELRPYAIQEEIPLLVKVIRYTYEHLEAYGTFSIPIPEDEPIEDDEDVETFATEEETEYNPVDSLSYLVALFKDAKNNKINIADLRSYANALLSYAEEN